VVTIALKSGRLAHLYVCLKVGHDESKRALCPTIPQRYYGTNNLHFSRTGANGRGTVRLGCNSIHTNTTLRPPGSIVRASLAPPAESPTIHGGPERYHPDHQQPCEPWLFVLREDAENYNLPEPRELSLDGSFAVFKMAMTDVVGFENFLQSNKDKINPELLAAKMCGRWHNGRPSGRDYTRATEQLRICER
jgi:hypothetical protein